MELGVQVMGCITASCIPVLVRSICAAIALRGLVGFLRGLLGLLRAKLARLGLETNGWTLGAIAAPKNGSS